MSYHCYLNSRSLIALLVLATACGDDTSGNGGTGSSSDGADANDDTPGDETPGEDADGSGSTTEGEDSTTSSADDTVGSTDDTTTGGPEVPDTIPEIVKALVEQEENGEDVEGFPLAYQAGETDLRVIPALRWNLMSAFLEPITGDDAPTAPVWGANNDFIGYIGDGWERDGGTPYFAGAGDAGWMWTNFEYISNDRASVGSAPQGQGLQLVTWLNAEGVEEFQFDVTDSAQWTQERVDAYILWHKRMLGGALYRAAFDGEAWSIDPRGDNVRFDATSDTLFLVTGLDLETAQDDQGGDLPANVVPGTSSNCSGGITPWGTFLTAEENTQFAYGELQSCWASNNLFVPGGPCDPGSDIVWDTTPSASGDFTRGTATNNRPDMYGYLVEIDPAAAPNEVYDATSGNGHMKLGSLGRANWENATFAVGSDWALVPGQPIVIYSGDDRRGGRIYKWVSIENYEADMTKAEIRNLLADGYVYAAHFEDLDNQDDARSGAQGGVTVGGALATASTPGEGRWIRLDLQNAVDIAPNAGGGAGSQTRVGAALADDNWNGMGGFPDNRTILLGLHTASNKVGIRELNRPEDLEWNAVTGSLWIAFTNHTRPNALLANGTLNLDDPNTPEDDRLLSARNDEYGWIAELIEEDRANPGASMTFTFRAAWRGGEGSGLQNAGSPDNIALDSEGGIWFGTDGYFSAETSDAVYYLAVADDPADSRIYRIAIVPSDAEATGPIFSADEQSLFFNVQHPLEEIGEAPLSDFAEFGDLGPRSGQVAVTIAPR